VTTRVERVLGRLGIEAKRQGREWLARCPSKGHDDQNPSWRIRDDEGGEKDGYHRCWPCSFEGGLVELVKEVLGLKSREAKEWLASDAPAPIAPSYVELRSVPRGFRLPPGVEIGPLERWPSPVRRYAASRHITPAQVERWGLGYALEGRLQGRLVLPVRDRAGIPRGYTARAFQGQARRYLEPEAWEGADQGTLFGEQHWGCCTGATAGPLIVVEGALNALAVERAMAQPDSEGCRGIVPCVAATRGSKLSAAAALKLSGFSTVITATDPDDAGDKLADEIAWVLARQGVRCERARLPAGVDADEVGPALLRDLLDSAMWAVRW
jgi:DNA primase